MLSYLTRIDICTGMDAMAMLILVALTITMLFELKVKGERLSFLFGTLGACFIMLAGDVLQSHVYVGVLPKDWYMISEGIMYVSIMAAALFLSFYMISELRKDVFINENVNYALVFGASVAVVIWFVGAMQDPNWFFDMSGELPHSKDGNIVIQIVPGIILLFDLLLAASCSGEVRAKHLRSWILVSALPLAALALSAGVTHFPAYAITSLCCLVLYFNIHNDAAKQQLINEKELVASKSQLMVSQIQPHFIYNSLNTIYYLIDMDQEQAKEAVSTFSDYLRQNINSLKDDKPVPFAEELEHIKAYVSLEKLRFGDRLNIVYKIDADDFLVPPLTIQPLVENAIKHGISVKEEGGTVTLMTRRTKDGIILAVADDGAGFDTTRYSDDNKSTHIGLYNVRGRLKNMCNAELTVSSEEGKGTICTILFRV